MNNSAKKNMVCGSLYHKWWFRFILFIVAVDMLVFGVLFSIGINVISFLPQMSIFLHVVFGLMYIIASLFIIYLVLSYKKIINHVYFICYRCGGEIHEE